MESGRAHSAGEIVSQRQIEAAGLLEQGLYEAALNCLYSELALVPLSKLTLKLLAETYSRADRHAEARDCRRGYVPESENHRFVTGLESERGLHGGDPETYFRPAWAAEQRPLTPPKHLGKFGEFKQFRYAATENAGSQTSVTAGGSIWFDGANTVVFDAVSRIIPMHSRGNEVFAACVANQREPVHHPGRVCALFGRSPYIYYHWMLDVLPQLAVLQKSGVALDEVDAFLVRAKQPYQLEALALAGIPAEKIRVGNGPLHSADELLVPFLKNDLGVKRYHGLGLGLASWIPDWLRTLAKPEAGVGAGAGTRLFVSRRGASTRSIANETELIEMLSAYGFATINPGDYSVAEQAALFANADLVIGLHGAGLTNIVFCPPGARVIELFGNYKVPCYWVLANLCGHSYATFVCDDRIDQRRAGDITVDIQRLSAVLEEYCSP